MGETEEFIEEQDEDFDPLLLLDEGDEEAI